MPATAEWIAEEANAVSLPTMVSSTDLFDGELFGDELIDIYNSTVEGSVEAIPTLETPAPKEGEEDEDHPGAQVAATAAAIDDGLGAFRPSTSFNDLTTLMQPQEAEEAPANAVAPTTEVAAPSSPKPSKKRTAPPAEAPSPKRKAPARARRPAPKKQSSPTVKKNMVVEPVMSSAVPACVTPPGPSPGGEVVASAAAVEAAAAAAAVAAAIPALPELKSPAEVTSGVTLTMKTDETPEPAPSSSAVQATTTSEKASPGDSQFKSIAQQAVSNLIMSAGSSSSARSSPATTKGAPESTEDKARVDTSTAHIKALTGNNWVAACSTNSANGNSAASVSAAPAAPTSASAAPAESKTVSSNANSANRVRRQNLTPDERARQNRDRNREHARNTRLRKKAYVEELKRTLTELVAQRDAADLEKRQTAQREVEQREVRFRVIEEFLKLRGTNEGNVARWAAILEDGFVLTVPTTSLYRNTDGAEVTAFEQKLSTIQAIMAESTIFGGFLQTLRAGGKGTITMAFECDRKNFFMDGCNAFLEWTASTVGTKEAVTMKGLIRGKFSPASNKLLSASISFDCGALSAQAPSKSPPAANEEVDVAAAQADAILDSLEFNHVHLNVVVPSDVSVVVHPNSADSVITEKGAESSDESTSEHGEHDKHSNKSGGDGLGMTTRRVHRRD